MRTLCSTMAMLALMAAGIATAGEPPAALDGVVLGPDGKPVPGAIVSYANASVKSVVAKADGAFSYPMPTGYEDSENTLLLRAETVDRTQRGAAFTTGKSIGKVQCVIRLSPTATVTGRIVDKKELPIKNVTVQFRCMHEFAGRGRMTFVYDEIKNAGDADGKFAISTMLGDCPVEVNATAEGYGQVFVRSAVYRPGETRDLGSLVLSKADQSVAGVVLDAEDKPVPNVKVSVYGRKTVRVFAWTDEKGAFRFHNVCDEPGLYVQASSESMHWSGHADAGDMNVELRPRDGGATRPSLIGKTAPPLEVDRWLSGAPVSLAELKGKVVVLLFMNGGDGDLASVAEAAKWIKDCRVVGMHAPDADPEAVQKKLKDAGISFPVAMDKANGASGVTHAAYRPRNLPAAFIIDAQGNVQYQQLDPKMIESALKKLDR